MVLAAASNTPLYCCPACRPFHPPVCPRACPPVQGLEKYVMSKVWPGTFGVWQEDRDRDERYVRLMAALAFVDLPTLMGAEEGEAVEADAALLDLAVAELLKVERYKAPRDKLLCLVNVKTMVEGIVAAAAAQGANIGGGWVFFQLLPLLGHVFSRTAGLCGCWSMFRAALSYLCVMGCSGLAAAFYDCLAACLPECQHVAARLTRGSGCRPPPHPCVGWLMTPAGADAFFPVFLYVVMRSRLPHLASNVEYVKRFRSAPRLSGQFDYMLCNLVSGSDQWPRFLLL